MRIAKLMAVAACLLGLSGAPALAQMKAGVEAGVSFLAVVP